MDLKKSTKSVFDLFIEGKGYITVDQLSTAIRATGLLLSERDVYEILADKLVFDEPCIGFDRFCELLRKYSANRNFDSKLFLKEIPQNLTKDGNGIISVSELRILLTQKGEKISDEDFDDMMTNIGIV
jgi:calmodulin